MSSWWSFATTRMKSSMIARCWRGRRACRCPRDPGSRPKSVQRSSGFQPWTVVTGMSVPASAWVMRVSRSSRRGSTCRSSRWSRRKPSRTLPSGRVTSTTQASRRATWRCRCVTSPPPGLRDPFEHALGQVVFELRHLSSPPRASRASPRRYRASAAMVGRCAIGRRSTWRPPQRRPPCSSRSPNRCATSTTTCRSRRPPTRPASPSSRLGDSILYPEVARDKYPYTADGRSQLPRGRALPRSLPALRRHVRRDDEHQVRDRRAEAPDPRPGAHGEAGQLAPRDVERARTSSASASRPGSRTSRPAARTGTPGASAWTR